MIITFLDFGCHTKHCLGVDPNKWTQDSEVAGSGLQELAEVAAAEEEEEEEVAEEEGLGRREGDEVKSSSLDLESRQIDSGSIQAGMAGEPSSLGRQRSSLFPNAVNAGLGPDLDLDPNQCSDAKAKSLRSVPGSMPGSSSGSIAGPYNSLLLSPLQSTTNPPLHNTTPSTAD
jgi:hypothetical protein